MTARPSPLTLAMLLLSLCAIGLLAPIALASHVSVASSDTAPEPAAIATPWLPVAMRSLLQVRPCFAATHAPGVYSCGGFRAFLRAMLFVQSTSELAVPIGMPRVCVYHAVVIPLQRL